MMGQFRLDRFLECGGNRSLAPLFSVATRVRKTCSWGL